jgi:hypothetical protein
VLVGRARGVGVGAAGVHLVLPLLVGGLVEDVAGPGDDGLPPPVGSGGRREVEPVGLGEQAGDDVGEGEDVAGLSTSQARQTAPPLIGMRRA